MAKLVHEFKIGEWKFSKNLAGRMAYTFVQYKRAKCSCDVHVM